MTRLASESKAGVDRWDLQSSSKTATISCGRWWSQLFVVFLGTLSFFTCLNDFTNMPRIDGQPPQAIHNCTATHDSEVWRNHESCLEILEIAKMSRPMVCRCVHVLTFWLKSCPQVSSLCNTELCNTFMSLCFEGGWTVLCFYYVFLRLRLRMIGLRPLKQQRLVVPRGMQFWSRPHISLKEPLGETLRMTFLFWFLLAVSLNLSFFKWFRY